MDEQLQILIAAILSIKDYKKSKDQIMNDLPELQKALDTDKNARLNITAGLNLAKSKQLIKAHLATLANIKDVPKIDIGVNVGNANVTKNITTGLQNVQTQVQQTSNSLTNLADKFKEPIKPVLDKNGLIDAEKTIEKVQKHFQTLGNVSVKGIYGDNLSDDHLEKIIVNIKNAQNEVRTLTFQIGELHKNQKKLSDKDAFYLTNGTSDNSGIQKLATQTEETRAKYSRLLADFKSSNSAIESGLITPIAEFEKILNGLGSTSSITDVKNAFESLKQSASEITKYLDTTNSSFNKSTNAVNNYKNMDNILKQMTTSFNNLTLKPEGLKSELDGVRSKLIELQDLEKSEGGYTSEWAKKYQEVNLELTRVKANIDLVVKAESKSQKADKNSAYQTQLKYLNKIKEETNTIISYKKKMVNAGTEESAIYQHEIEKAKRRIQYDIKQLEKKKLLTEEAQRLINVYQRQVELQTEINSAKAVDKSVQNNTKQLEKYRSEVTKTVSELNKISNNTQLNKSSNNPQVQQLKADIQSLINDYQKLMTTIQTTNPTDSAGMANLNAELNTLKSRFDVTSKSAKDLQATLKNTQGTENLTAKIKVLQNQLVAYKNANSKAMNSNKLSSNNITFAQEIDTMLAKLKQGVDPAMYQKIANNFRIIKSEVKALGLEGSGWIGQLWANMKKFASWMSMTTVMSRFAMECRQAVTELKEIDTILTEISKTSDRTAESLRELGKVSFDTASKYGRTASDYLTGVQEMSRAGFAEKASEEMAELSILAQSAGDMEAELANSYLIATNAAYKFGGSAEKLNSVLDSQNYITNRNALNMTELANATKVAGSQASVSSVSIDEMTAAVGTMIATTQEGGETAGRAFKAILMNLQQVSAEADDIGDGGEAITSESLTKYEKACADLGVSLKEVKNGVVTLRKPMEILEELSVSVSKEAEGSVKVANLINAIGGKHRGNQLVSLLKNWETYKKMLSEFNSAEAESSAFNEAMKTAESWQGKLNELSNSFSELINNFANSDVAKTVLDGANSVITALDEITKLLGAIPTLITAIVGVTAIKGSGRSKIDSPYKYARIALLVTVNEIKPKMVA